MSTSHTPGPWTTRPIYGSLPAQAHALFWQDGQRSRRLDDGGVFRAGDARLIAAAPDLLAALRAMVYDTPSPATKKGSAALDAALAAIAKAEGRE